MKYVHCATEGLLDERLSQLDCSDSDVFYVVVASIVETALLSPSCPGQLSKWRDEQPLAASTEGRVASVLSWEIAAAAWLVAVCCE